MFNPWFDWIGDVNAQMFREWKGRLKPQSVLIVMALAIAGQFLLMAHFQTQLPSEFGYPVYFCEINSATRTCLMDAQGQPIILWGKWWQSIFQSVNWCLILLAMLPGVYFLATDVDREERQGTLDFIRLSPQSSRSIMFGKMLGVPVLVYLAIACILPFHWYTAMRASAPPAFLLSFYIMLMAGCWFIYSATLLGGFLSKLQASLVGIQIGSSLSLVMVLVVLMWFVPAYVSWNLATTWHPYTPFLIGPNASTDSTNLQWFHLPIGTHLLLAHGFTLAVLAMGSFWIWQAVDRCFHSPGRTILGKAQSYSLVAFLELLTVGFFFQEVRYGYHDTFYLDNFIAFAVLNTVLFIGLTFLLANHRQALLDWARFRHFYTPTSRQQTPEPQLPRATRVNLWKDLLLGEKSPANLAIALNLLIFAALTLLWIAGWGSEYRPAYLFAAILLTVNMMAIYAAIIQLMLMMKNTKRFIWTVLALALVMGLPLAIAAFYHDNHQLQAIRWLLLSPAPAAAFYSGQLGIGLIVQAFVAQVTALVALNGKLTLQLRRAGESASKTLLDETSRRAALGQPAMRSALTK